MPGLGDEGDEFAEMIFNQVKSFFGRMSQGAWNDAKGAARWALRSGPQVHPLELSKKAYTALREYNSEHVRPADGGLTASELVSAVASGARSKMQDMGVWPQRWSHEAPEADDVVLKPHYEGLVSVYAANKSDAEFLVGEFKSKGAYSHLKPPSERTGGLWWILLKPDELKAAGPEFVGLAQMYSYEAVTSRLATNAACSQAAPDVAGVDFTPGSPGNAVFTFDTVVWDPRAKILTDNLDELGIPYSIEYAAWPDKDKTGAASYGQAVVEIDPVHIHAVQELAETLGEVARVKASRFKLPVNGESVYSAELHPEAACKVKGQLEEMGIPFESVMLKNGSEQVLVAASDVSAHGFALGRDTALQAAAQPGLSEMRTLAFAKAEGSRANAQRVSEEARAAAKNQRESRKTPSTEVDERAARRQAREQSRSFMPTRPLPSRGRA